MLVSSVKDPALFCILIQVKNLLQKFDTNAHMHSLKKMLKYFAPKTPTKGRLKLKVPFISIVMQLGDGGMEFTKCLNCNGLLENIKAFAKDKKSVTAAFEYNIDANFDMLAFLFSGIRETVILKKTFQSKRGQEVVGPVTSLNNLVSCLQFSVRDQLASKELLINEENQQ